MTKLLAYKKYRYRVPLPRGLGDDRHTFADQRAVVRRAGQRFFVTGQASSSFFDLIFLQGHILFSVGEVRALLFFPADLGRCRGACAKANLSTFDAWHKRRHNNSRATGAAAFDG